MADQTLDIVIRMLADGKGAQVTKQQIGEVSKLIDDLNSKVSRTGADDRTLANAQNVVNALGKTVTAAKAAGEKIGEEMGKGAGKRMEESLERQFTGLAGRLSSIPGFSTIFAAGGIVGAGLSASINVVSAAVNKVSSDFAKLREEYRGLGELSESLRRTQQSNPEYLTHLRDVARSLGDGKVQTKDWLAVLKELHTHDAAKNTIEPLAKDVKILAGLMGGDLATATRVVTEATRGNYESLRQFGIVVDSTMSDEQALAFVHQELAIRSVELGNAFVDASDGAREFKKAGEEVADALSTISLNANEADQALGRMLDKIESMKSDEIKILDAQERQQLAQLDHAKGSGLIRTEEEYEMRKSNVRKSFAERRITANRNAMVAKQAPHELMWDDAQTNIFMRDGEMDNTAQRIGALDKKISGRRREMQPRADAMEEVKRFLDEMQRTGQVPGGSLSPAGQQVYQQVFRKENGEQRSVEQQRATLTEMWNGLQEEFSDVGTMSNERSKLQVGLEEMRKSFKALDDADVTRMERAAEALRKIGESLKNFDKVEEINKSTNTIESETRRDRARETDQKNLEQRAKEFQRKNQLRQRDGLPLLQRPGDLPAFDVGEDGQIDFSPKAPPPARRQQIWPRGYSPTGQNDAGATNEAVTLLDSINESVAALLPGLRKLDDTAFYTAQQAQNNRGRG